MKKLIYIILILMLCSCSEKVIDPYSKYCDCEVVERGNAVVGYWLRFRHEGTITDRIYVTKFDWGNFELGETLRCNKDTNIEDVQEIVEELIN